jgi:hypothetical protein
MASARAPKRKAPSWVRYGMLGAVAAGSFGVVNSFIAHAQYGFSQKIGAPIQLSVDACLALCLALLGFVLGALAGAVQRWIMGSWI